MKKILLLTAATALLSSCGIYNRYTPVETVPDNLYGSFNKGWRIIRITALPSSG